MVKTNAERQADYRARASKRANGDGETRLNMYINVRASLALEELATTFGGTKKELIELLLLEELERVRTNKP